MPSFSRVIGEFFDGPVLMTISIPRLAGTNYPNNQ